MIKNKKERDNINCVHLFDISNVSYVYTHNHVIYKREREKERHAWSYRDTNNETQKMRKCNRISIIVLICMIVLLIENVKPHIVDPGSSNELQTRFFVFVKQCDTYGFVQTP